MERGKEGTDCVCVEDITRRPTVAVCCRSCCCCCAQIAVHGQSATCIAGPRGGGRERREGSTSIVRQCKVATVGGTNWQQIHALCCRCICSRLLD